MVSVSSISASAPGSLMLLGEHAVLHGRRALACAVNRRMTVTLTPRTDREIRLTSALGVLRISLDAPSDLSGPFRFVLAALHSVPLEQGVDLTVTSEFSDQVGLGSSAAVTVATVAAAQALAGIKESAQALHDRCLGVIHAVQGVGSGTDAAASIQGGIVAYRNTPRELYRLPHQHPIALVYAGFKTPTVEVVAHVERKRKEQPELFDALFNAVDDSIDEAIAAIQREDWEEVGAILNANQGYMEQMGVANEELDEIIDGMRSSPGILGAKISGSGLGDCAVALGRLAPWPLPYEPINVEISDDGVWVE